MQNIEEYCFWCWKPKVLGVVQLLYLLSGRVFSTENANSILEELRYTNADKNEWAVHNISLVPGLWQLAMAFDEDDNDIVHIKIKAPAEFQERIQFLDQIQSLLKTIEIESR